VTRPTPPHREGVAAQVVVTDLDDPAGPLLDDGARHHLGRVLRLRPDEVVCATDGAGGWRRCTFDGGERLVPLGEADREPPPSDPVTVAFVPVKGDRPELVVQKLTELGVDRIVVTSSERSVVRWEGDRAAKHLEKLRRVALEATQQCRRLWLPTVESVPLAALLADGAALADMGGEEPASSLRTVVVGPEGGWTDRERAAATVPPVSLGEHVLRAETAAISAGVVLAALRRRG
jgi:16S rRNA (uracil1498-N3)-methyltransferase